jgi:hypothetical protein
MTAGRLTETLFQATTGLPRKRTLQLSLSGSAVGHFRTPSAAVVMTEQKPLIRAIVQPACYLRSVVQAA